MQRFAFNRYVWFIHVQLDVSFARDVYTKAVKRSVQNGTTTCVYYSTIHLQASEALAGILAK